jgi:hypothetical protein
VLLRVRFPEKEVLDPVSPEGSEYSPDSMERRAWANLEGIVLSSLANVEGPEILRNQNFELHIFAYFQYIGVPGGVFLDNEEGWLRHELKEKLPEFVRNPAAGEATLIEYDRPEVGRCRVSVRIVNYSNDRVLTIESVTATSSEMAPETDPEPVRSQALNQLRNALDQVKAQARGDADLRRESAELLEEALGELRMPSVEAWAPAEEELGTGTEPCKPMMTAQETIERLQKLRDRDAIQTFLDRFVVGRTWKTLEDNQLFTNALNDHLRPLNLRVACVVDGKPSLFRCYSTTSAHSGAYYFDHSKSRHGGSPVIPKEMKVVEASPDPRRTTSKIPTSKA